uniref:Uncharacterized protein n=1 Tax=Ditylenchus dipsaci TaxID=166011 RepID=A0A915DVS1_9BILA
MCFMVYYNKLELNKTQVDFKKAVLQANPSSLNYAYKPVRNSLYDVHLARWLEYFPISQVLVLDGDNFIRDPLKQLRLTEKF